MSRQLVIDLPLPCRTRDALVRAGIYIDEDLRLRSRKQLLVVSGIGPRGVDQIEKYLSRCSLPGQVDDMRQSTLEKTMACAA